jgi:hypothetical protein
VRLEHRGAALAFVLFVFVCLFVCLLLLVCV